MNYLVVSAFTSEADDLLKYVMVSVGTVFAEFLFKTFNPDESESITQLMARSDFPSNNSGDIRSLLNVGFASEVLGGLDYDPEKYSYLSDAFESFFNNIDLDRVLLH